MNKATEALEREHKVILKVERFGEAERYFLRLSDAYEHHYYLGLLHERRAKARLRLGHPKHILADMFQDAMHYFEEAEKLHPAGNDDAILRWNRCARLLETLSPLEKVEREVQFEAHDSAPESKLHRTG